MPSVIYFVRRESDGLIKIGTTTNLQRRLKGFENQFGKIECLGTIVGGTVREKILHWCFNSQRVVSEWFQENDEIITLVNKYAKPHESSCSVDTPNGLLDVAQIQFFLSISYPTALQFAKEHGRLDPGGSSRGKWLISTAVVRDVLEKQRQDIDRRLAMIPNGSEPTP